MSVGVSACAVPQHLRDRVDRFAGDVVRDGVGELTDDVAGALGPLDAGGQHNDGRLVGGDLAELHGHLGGRALDLSGVAERTVRGVLVAAQPLGGRRVRDDEGVGLRVVLDRVAVEAPARTGGGLVNDGGTGHGRVACRQNDAPHDGLVLVTIFRVGQVEPAVLLVTGLAGGAASHLEVASNLATDLDDVGFAARAGVVSQAVRGDRSVPLRGGLHLVIEDNGDGTVSGPGTAADRDVVVRDDVEGARDVRAQNGLAGRLVDRVRVVGEVVTSLDTPLGLPGQLDAEVPPVAHRMNFMSRVVNQLNVLPIQRDLVAHVSKRRRARRAVRIGRDLHGDELCDAKET